MFIVTDKNFNIVNGIGTLKEYQSNGYPVITDEKGNDCAYPINFVNLHEVDSIPNGVDPEKYCYTPETGFYENPNYREPASEEEQWVKDLINEVAEHEY